MAGPASGVASMKDPFDPGTALAIGAVPGKAPAGRAGRRPGAAADTSTGTPGAPLGAVEAAVADRLEEGGR